MGKHRHVPYDYYIHQHNGVIHILGLFWLFTPCFMSIHYGLKKQHFTAASCPIFRPLRFSVRNPLARELGRCQCGIKGVWKGNGKYLHVGIATHLGTLSSSLRSVLGLPQQFWLHFHFFTFASPSFSHSHPHSSFSQATQGEASKKLARARSGMDWAVGRVRRLCLFMRLFHFSLYYQVGQES